MNKLLVALLGLILTAPLFAPPKRIGRTPVMGTGLRPRDGVGRLSRSGKNFDRKKLDERMKKKRELAEKRRREMRDRQREERGARNPGDNEARSTRSDAGAVQSGKVEVQYDPSKNVSTKTDEGEVITIPIMTHFKKLSKHARVHLDFYDTELSHIIKFISDRTGTNFIVSGNLRNKKITMFCPKKVRAIDALNAFFTVLSIHNLSVIRSGSFYRIVNATDANKPYNLYYQNERVPNVDYYVTKMYQLKYVSTDDVERLINRLKSRSGVVVSYKPTNLILFTDQGILVNKIFKIVRQIDIPTDTATDKIWMVPVYYGDAKDIANKLEEIFDLKSKRNSRNRNNRSSSRPIRSTPSKGKKKSGASTTAKGEEEQLEIERIIADERSNQLIIVSNEASKLKVVDLIKKLDIPLEDDSTVHVYYLKNAKAEDVARTINSLAGGSSSRRRSSSRRGSSYTPAAKGVMFQGEVKVTADKSTNTLVIVASGRDYNNLRKVIDKLDLKRRQVYVEAVIMELSIDKTRSLGMSLAGGMEKQIAGETVPMYGGSNVKELISPDSRALAGFAFGAMAPSISITDNLSIPSFGVTLRALQSNKNANILSSPHVLTMDNEEAEFLVGENVPFPSAMTSATSSALGAYAPTISIQRQDVALKLGITPQISENGEVKLEMKLEITDVKSPDATLGPTTSKRSVKTTVVVPDQQTIVIGGLTKDNIKDTEYKVPILGDIPVVGHFFKTTEKEMTKSNLMVFLTPYIVRNSSDMEKVWRKKRAEFEEFKRLKNRADKGFDIFVDYNKKRGLFSEINREVDAFQKRIKLDKEMSKTREYRYDEDLKTQQERFKKEDEARAKEAAGEQR